MVIGSLVLGLIVLLTVADVILRYLFNSPIFGASEAIQYLLGLTVFTGMYLVTRDGGHVSVSLLDPLIRERAPRLFLFIFRLFSTLGIGLIAWILFWRFFDTLEYPESSVVLEIPLEYVYGSFALLSALVVMAAMQCKISRGEME